MKTKHEWDEDGCCIHCKVDGAAAWCENQTLIREIGQQEFDARKDSGAFDYQLYCERVL